jgi:hypothetical protein
VRHPVWAVVRRVTVIRRCGSDVEVSRGVGASLMRPGMSSVGIRRLGHVERGDGQTRRRCQEAPDACGSAPEHARFDKQELQHDRDASTNEFHDT